MYVVHYRVSHLKFLPFYFDFSQFQKSKKMSIFILIIFKGVWLCDKKASKFNNCRIFLSLFYVKSILQNLRTLKLLFCQFRGSKYCKFGKFQPSNSARIHKSPISDPQNVSKCQILRFKIHQIWFHVKARCQKNSLISRLWHIVNDFTFFFSCL